MMSSESAGTSVIARMPVPDSSIGVVVQRDDDVVLNYVGFTPGKYRDVSNTFHVDGHKCVEGLGHGTRFALETLNLDCRIEFSLADGKTKVKEFRLRNYITGPYQTVTATLPEEVAEDGIVKMTLSMQPTAPGPNVSPVVVEKSVAELRAVRRKSNSAALD